MSINLIGSTSEQAYDMEYDKITKLGWIEMEDFDKRLEELVDVY